MEPGTFRDSAGRSFWVYKTYMQPEINLDPDTDPLALEPEFTPEPDMEQDPLNFAFKQEPGVKLEMGVKQETPPYLVNTSNPRFGLNINVAIKSEHSSPTIDPVEVIEISSDEDDILSDTELRDYEPFDLYSSMSRETPNPTAVLPTNVEDEIIDDIALPSECSKDSFHSECDDDFKGLDPPTSVSALAEAVLTNVGDRSSLDETMSRHRKSSLKTSISREKKFKCNICFKLVTTLSNLKQHKEFKHTIHTPTKSICKERKSSFKSPVSREKKFKCNICPKVVTSLGRLKQHEKFHTAKKSKCKEKNLSLQSSTSPVKKFECDICSKLVTTLAHLKQHKESHISKKLVTSEGRISYEKKFKCNICQKRVRTLYHLKRHNEIHIPKKYTGKDRNEVSTTSRQEFHSHRKSHHKIKTKQAYKCDICSKVYSELANLNRHKITHTANPKPYKCKYCFHVCGCISNMRTHERRHLQNPFTCLICRKRFTTMGHIKRHSRLHMHKCDVCNIHYMNSALLHRHKKLSHTNKSSDLELSCRTKKAGIKKRHECGSCKITFSSSIELTNHKKVQVEKPFRCKLCCNNYASYKSLDQHKRNNHLGIEHTCDICQKSFLHQSNFERHKLIHSKPFQCDTCQKKFATKKSFETHSLKSHPTEEFKTKREMQIHEKSKRYECEECDICFIHKPSFQRHLETHATEKTHRCAVCGEMFGLIRSLEIHRRDHNRTCFLCNKEFTRSSDMKRHIKLKSCVMLK